MMKRNRLLLPIFILLGAVLACGGGSAPADIGNPPPRPPAGNDETEPDSDALASIKDELFFGSGIPIELSCIIPPPQDTPLPWIQGGADTICLWGFPSGESISLTLRSPDGQIFSKDFRVGSQLGGDLQIDELGRFVVGDLDRFVGDELVPDPGSGLPQIGEAPEIVGGLAPQLPEGAGDIVLQPPDNNQPPMPTSVTVFLTIQAGAPPGEWRVSADSGSGQAETTFHVPKSESLAIDIVRSLELAPYAGHEENYYTFSRGEPFFIVGTGLEAGEQIPFGIYEIGGRSGLNIQALLVQDQIVTANEQGGFPFAISVEAPDAPGRYCAIIVEDPDAEFYNFKADNVACFDVVE